MRYCQGRMSVLLGLGRLALQVSTVLCCRQSQLLKIATYYCTYILCIIVVGSTIICSVHLAYNRRNPFVTLVGILQGPTATSHAKYSCVFLCIVDPSTRCASPNIEEGLCIARRESRITSSPTRKTFWPPMRQLQHDKGPL